VNKGQLVVTLTSDSLTNSVQNASDSVQNAQTALDNQQSKLDSYTVKSPISGTVIEKDCKEGDTLQAGQTLCKIYDLSYLTMTLNIDELDISNVKVGQAVTVTADAVAGKTYEGTVTRISIVGSTSNGATSYPVTVRIDSTDGLLPGMNVQASITLQESDNVVAIPVTALVRGNRVLVKDGSASAAAGNTGGNFTRPSDGSFTPPSDGNFTRPSGGDFTMPSGGGSFTPPSGAYSGSGGAAQTGAPAGYTYVTVTTGVSDGSYIEITGGLQAGDVIGVPVTSTTSSSNGNNAIGVFPGAGGGYVNRQVIGGNPGSFTGGQNGAPAGAGAGG